MLRFIRLIRLTSGKSTISKKFANNRAVQICSTAIVTATVTVFAMIL